jgi:hypothetical protein
MAACLLGCMAAYDHDPLVRVAARLLPLGLAGWAARDWGGTGRLGVVGWAGKIRKNLRNHRIFPPNTKTDAMEAQPYPDQVP